MNKTSPRPSSSRAELSLLLHDISCALVERWACDQSIDLGPIRAKLMQRCGTAIAVEPKIGTLMVELTQAIQTYADRELRSCAGAFSGKACEREVAPWDEDPMNRGSEKAGLSEDPKLRDEAHQGAGPGHHALA